MCDHAIDQQDYERLRCAYRHVHAFTSDLVERMQPHLTSQQRRAWEELDLPDPASFPPPSPEHHAVMLVSLPRMWRNTTTATSGH